MEFEQILLPILDLTNMNITAKILAVRGATHQSIERKAKDEMSNSDYDMVFIMLGVNNVTKIFYKIQMICAFDNVP